MIYRFRAECQDDVDAFGQLIPGHELISMRVEPDSNGFPDRDVTLELKTLNLKQLRALMRQVDDGHVMVQTVAAAGEYTGERNYKL